MYDASPYMTHRVQKSSAMSPLNAQNSHHLGIIRRTEFSTNRVKIMTHKFMTPCHLSWLGSSIYIRFNSYMQLLLFGAAVVRIWRRLTGTYLANAKVPRLKPCAFWISAVPLVTWGRKSWTGVLPRPTRWASRLRLDIGRSRLNRRASSWSRLRKTARLCRKDTTTYNPNVDRCDISADISASHPAMLLMKADMACTRNMQLTERQDFFLSCKWCLSIILML